MSATSSQSASSAPLEDLEEPFPLMRLPNELLAGVTQRLSEDARRRFEWADQRAAAVTRAHGYIRRHHEPELSIEQAVSDSDEQPIIRVGGFGVAPHEAPAAVRWLLARRRRFTCLALLVEDEFDADWFESTREPLVAVLDILLVSDHLKLTTVTIDACFGRGGGDVAAGVSRLVQRHAATIVHVCLDACCDDGDAAEHEHVELCQAVAACVGVQRFELLVADRGCLKTVERDCWPSFSQLRVLQYCDATDSLVNFGALARPSKLEALVIYSTGCMAEMLLQRPDVVASLRHLRVLHFEADLPDGFLDAAPRLHSFVVGSSCWVVPLADCDPPFARALVSQFFAASGKRRMFFKLNVTLGDVSIESLCAQLLSAFHAAVPDVAIDCSDSAALVLGCRAILKAAVEANPAAAAVMGRAFSVQLNGADASACAAVIYAATTDLADYADAAPHYTALVALAGGRVRLDTALADRIDQDDVAFELTRGDGADKRQLHIVVSLFCED